MTVQTPAYFWLGKALALFAKEYTEPIDRIISGWRIKVQKIEETKHRDDMMWEDLGVESIRITDSGIVYKR